MENSDKFVKLVQEKILKPDNDKNVFSVKLDSESCKNLFMRQSTTKIRIYIFCFNVCHNVDYWNS